MDKYIYLNNNEYENIGYLLFSNQSHLNSIENLNKNYDSFYELILNEKIKKDMFYKWQISNVDLLIDKKCIFIDKDGFLYFNKELVWILKELYVNSVLSYCYVKKYQEIKRLKNEEVIITKSSLLSQPEQNYLNFLLNKSEFSNGLDLRNKYAHGTQPLDEKENENNYFKFLEIIVLLVIKINEEFYLNDSINNKKC